MKYIKQALCGLILAWISLGSIAQTPEAQKEVEYASVPQAAPAAAGEGGVRPKVGKSAKKKNVVAEPVPPAPAESVALPPAPPVVEVPAWRTSVAAILEPFGLNGLMTKMGMSGPAADILGMVILLFAVSIILFIVLRLAQALRQQLLDQVARKRLAEPVKDEPLMEADPGHSRLNTRNGQHSRMGSNTRSGYNSRLGANSRGGPDSRMGHSPESRLGHNNNTRGGPDSRMGPSARGGADSRLGANTRSGHDSRARTRGGPDSRLGAHTRGGADSRLGLVTLDGHSRMDTRSGSYGGNEQVINAPEGFDKPRFLRKTRVYFLRLQTAWDKSDFSSVRQFAATPVYTELRKQMLERGDTTNCTDVLAIQTELLGIEVVAGNYIATVKFTGMIKETENPNEQAFDEVWRLSHPRDKQGDWVLSGIVQYS